MSLAGWCSGRFKAVKLCQSSSISGPSEMSKPIFRKISIILFFTIDIGCLEPNLRNSAGFVKSSKLSFDFFVLNFSLCNEIISLTFCFTEFICRPTSLLSLLGTSFN